MYGEIQQQILHDIRWWQIRRQKCFSMRKCFFFDEREMQISVALSSRTPRDERPRRNYDESNGGIAFDTPTAHDIPFTFFECQSVSN